MNPPITNMTMTARNPAVFVMTTVLHTPETNLKSAADICWIKKTARRCLKNLQQDEYDTITV
jgi:hypothetical protein